MSVTIDATVPAQVTNGNSATLSWTHTPVGTPSAAGVFFQNQDGTLTVTGVTYGGVAMSNTVDATVASHAGNPQSLQIWGLASPPSGAQTVVITGTVLVANQVNIIAASRTVTGSSLTTCFRSGASGSSFATAPFSSSCSVSVSGTVSGDLVCDVVGTDDYGSSDSSISGHGGSQTVDFSPLNNGNGFANQAGGSYQQATTSPTVMSWSFAGSGIPTFGNFYMGVAAAAFQVASAGAVVDTAGSTIFRVQQPGWRWRRLPRPRLRYQ